MLFISTTKTKCGHFLSDCSAYRQSSVYLSLCMATG